jgi:hypothetical protein
MQGKQHRLPFKVANKPAQVLFEMKLQAIRSKGRATRLFVNVPLALAAALDMKPGEALRWQLINRSDLRLVRLGDSQPGKTSKKCQ